MGKTAVQFHRRLATKRVVVRNNNMTIVWIGRTTTAMATISNADVIPDFRSHPIDQNKSAMPLVQAEVTIRIQVLLVCRGHDDMHERLFIGVNLARDYVETITEVPG